MESALLLEKRPEVFGLPAFVGRTDCAIEFRELLGVFVNLAHDALGLATGLLAQRLLIDQHDAALRGITGARLFRNSRRLATGFHSSGV